MQINPAEFKLLVVDDVQTNVLLLKALLGKEGYGILVANNGQEALEVIRNENPDLILLDVMMPGMDGFEVAERLKSEEFRCEIPIIFLTALDDTQSIVNGFKLGVGDFISKPFRKEELMVRIKHQLSLVAARRIIEEKNEELRKTIAGRDKMYSVIAHDLRSPMASMKMLLNTIMMSVEKDKIDPDIFDMFELGKLTVIPQKLDISGLADGGVEVMNSVAEVKHIKLIRTDHESFFVYVDIEMIKSILRNLISNAVKFSNPDSDIKVGIKAEDGKVIVSVTDSGKGIKKEDQHKLLKDSTHFTTYGTNSEEGSGLGLLLCRDFARKNGGELWFESEENLGSVFSFSLPQLIA